MGALVNAVFLMALCFTIIVESVQRFIVIEEIEDPILILIVGGIGLLINGVGLCLFSTHGKCPVDGYTPEIPEPVSP